MIQPRLWLRRWILWIIIVHRHDLFIVFCCCPLLHIIVCHRFFLGHKNKRPFLADIFVDNDDDDDRRRCWFAVHVCCFCRSSFHYRPRCQHTSVTGSLRLHRRPGGSSSPSPLICQVGLSLMVALLHFRHQSSSSNVSSSTVAVSVTEASLPPPSFCRSFTNCSSSRHCGDTAWPMPCQVQSIEWWHLYSDYGNDDPILLQVPPVEFSCRRWCLWRKVFGQ